MQDATVGLVNKNALISSQIAGNTRFQGKYLFLKTFGVNAFYMIKAQSVMTWEHTWALLDQ